MVVDVSSSSQTQPQNVVKRMNECHSVVKNPQQQTTLQIPSPPPRIQINVVSSAAFSTLSFPPRGEKKQGLENPRTPPLCVCPIRPKRVTREGKSRKRKVLQANTGESSPPQGREVLFDRRICTNYETKESLGLGWTWTLDFHLSPMPPRGQARMLQIVTARMALPQRSGARAGQLTALSIQG